MLVQLTCIKFEEKSFKIMIDGLVVKRELA